MLQGTLAVDACVCVFVRGCLCGCLFGEWMFALPTRSFAEAEKLALQINKVEFALPSTPGASTSLAAATAIAPWLWSLPPHEHSCVKVTGHRLLLVSRLVHVFDLQITFTGSGGSTGQVSGCSGVELARGASLPKAVVGGGGGSVQVRALALETMDAAGVRR